MSKAYGYASFFMLYVISSCTNLGPNATFYFPVEELEDGLVYAYESVDKDNPDKHYWYYRSVNTQDSTVLTGTYYDVNFEPLQFTNERIVPTGSLRRDLKLFAPTDSTSVNIQAKVLDPALFSFEPANTDRLLISKVSWKDHLLDTSGVAPIYTLTNKRHYLKDTSFTFSEQNLNAQAWMVEELIEQDSIGVLSIESRAIEIYAEGLGLVYRERIYNDGTVTAFKLKGRFSMDSLTQLATQ